MCLMDPVLQGAVQRCGARLQLHLPDVTLQQMQGKQKQAKSSSIEMKLLTLRLTANSRCGPARLALARPAHTSKVIDYFRWTYVEHCLNSRQKRGRAGGRAGQLAGRM